MKSATDFVFKNYIHYSSISKYTPTIIIIHNNVTHNLIQGGGGFGGYGIVSPFSKRSVRVINMHNWVTYANLHLILGYITV